MVSSTVTANKNAMQKQLGTITRNEKPRKEQKTDVKHIQKEGHSAKQQFYGNV